MNSGVNKLALRVALVTASVAGIRRHFKSARTSREGGTTDSNHFTVEVLGFKYEVTIRELPSEPIKKSAD